ncbi:MAG: alpha/beta hydrolase [Pseudomonadota bacterium]
MKVCTFFVFIFLTACTQTSLSTKTMINGVELDYQVRGSGPPLYLLHGGLESRDSFENQIPSFAEHFTVVALDSRKQGRSGNGPPGLPISYELMSADVIGLARHLGHPRISIVGLSDGGITAITAAIEHPEFVDRLVLLGATYHYSAYPDTVREFITNYEWDGNTDPTRYPGNFIKHYLTGREDLTEFAELLDEMATMWTTSPTFKKSDLEQIEARTLVINGDREDVPLEHTFELYNSLPDAQLFVVPNATHYALEEHPELLNDVILQFLLSSK